MSKIHSDLFPAVTTATSTATRAGTSAADAVKSGVKVGTTLLPPFPSGTLTPRPPAANTPFYSSRLEKLRAAVLDGTYKVDARRIADRLVALEKMCSTVKMRHRA